MIRDSIDETKELDAILKLHKEVFGSSDNLVQKMRSKPNLLIMAAMDGEKVVGYKLGYELDQHTFYSWLGGIDADYRKRGIASRLMEKQHHYLKEKGYTVVQTKTMNKWRSMLVLNIKSGFDIIDVYTDEKGQRKIVLEKELTL
ncbi:GNAT family N-acetyltransferase [Bacillus mangrovi]|uniref:GNAT family N-acetyltransferase n=2 Tax=Metabacillus mangrovi TaxID=1491830 RepID=A0A7X2V5X2_9BACI|nr:GNAT family N-acetyltransferase [Metabacillus mangrovi]